MDKIGESNPAIKAKLLSGQVKFRKKDIRILGESEYPFETYENRVKKVKASILSYINMAIHNRDMAAISKLKKLVDRLAEIINAQKKDLAR